MNTVGLITEYNPFHNGHLYHLENSKFLTKSDYSISIMSGNFLQRGEPALLDKWHRAKMAVKNGVDLVLELPFAYACQSAEFFAYGAVKTLNALNIVDYISFGSEAGKIDYLENIADILLKEPLKYKSFLKDYLSEGLSFPKARELALSDYFKDENHYSMEIENIITCSNNILGIEYIKSLKKLKSDIKPFTVQRVSSRYNDLDLKDEISSATAIRNTFFKTGDLPSVKGAVPDESFKIMEEFLSLNMNFNSFENFSDILFYLLTMKSGAFSEIMDMDRDLENRMLYVLKDSNSLNQYLENVKTKRYTMTRIKRVLTHLIMQISKSDIGEFMNTDKVYIRVLASNKKGFQLLKEIKKSSDVCIVNKVSEAKPKLDGALQKMLELDISATDVYYLGLNKHSAKLKRGLDYYISPYVEK